MACMGQASQRPTPRQIGERLATIIGAEEDRWMFTLWLDLLAHATRHPEFRATAAEFWKQTRRLIALGISEQHELTSDGSPESIASAIIALDLGLAIQHVVDPEEVPLSTYPEVFDLLFGRRI
ncbi:MAG: TetR family transcriptional regulator C-terminal domain-containing protein [Actinobacteria bacterium]|nr:TetR family transcriptional regulator C-terminal domain-containing protein [Actinomycetota bacterium]